jgi:hypothetical protein
LTILADSDRPAPEFNLAIVRGVEKVTHLIPESDTCLGEVVVQRACFAAPAVMLGLCMGLTTAPFVSTTEVYPDSPTVTDEVRVHIYRMIYFSCYNRALSLI